MIGDLDLGTSIGRGVVLLRPVVVVTAQESLMIGQCCPSRTSDIDDRSFGSEVHLSADERKGLESDSAAQCQQMRSISVDRVES